MKYHGETLRALKRPEKKRQDKITGVLFFFSKIHMENNVSTMSHWVIIVIDLLHFKIDNFSILN